MVTFAEAFAAALPKAVSLTLSHNDHAGVYTTVAQAVEEGDHGYTKDCWVSAEERERAIETNECWTLQWYPDTPVGFYLLSASTLPALIAALSEREG